MWYVVIEHEPEPRVRAMFEEQKDAEAWADMHAPKASIMEFGCNQLDDGAAKALETLDGPGRGPGAKQPRRENG